MWDVCKQPFVSCNATMIKDGWRIDKYTKNQKLAVVKNSKLCP
jgi:hypothetical protein